MTGPDKQFTQFLINNLYDYKGVKVSGSHMVNENDTWLRVEDSKLAKSLGNDEHIVYTLGTDNRRILIDNILFTDYFEVDEQKELVSEGNKYFNNWKIHSNQLQDENVNIASIKTEPIDDNGKVRVTLDLELTSPRLLVRILHRAHALVNVYAVRCLRSEEQEKSII